MAYLQNWRWYRQQYRLHRHFNKTSHISVPYESSILYRSIENNNHEFGEKIFSLANVTEDELVYLMQTMDPFKTNLKLPNI